MFGNSFTVIVMLVMFGVLIVGTVKAFWNLVNDETGKHVALNSRIQTGSRLKGSATDKPKSTAVGNQYPLPRRNCLSAVAQPAIKECHIE